MRNWHLSSEQLLALAEGKISLAESAQVADHLFNCSECWDAATEAISKLDRGSRPGQMSRQMLALLEKDPSLAAVVQKFRLEQMRLEQRLDAQACLGDLRGMSKKQRRDEIARRRPYRTRAMVDEILAEARRANPPDAEEWAVVATSLCRQLPDTEFSETERADLLAECCIELASARRRSARWNAAREAIREGRDCYKRGSLNKTIEGNLVALEGVIDGDIGSLDSADTHLHRAKDCFASAGETQLVAKTLAQLAYIWIDADPKKSLAYLGEVRPLIPAEDLKLRVLCEINRVDCLITLGLNREALRRFADLSDLCEQFVDPFVRLRLRFQFGRLLEASRRFSEADAVFREVISVDLEQRSTKALFLDLVYLFGSYVRRGDFSGAAEVCEDAIEQLTALELGDSPEAKMRALWQGLMERAQGGAVALSIVDRSKHYIRNQWSLLGGDPLASKESAVGG